MITKCISRFAPSPTGRLHLGHAWSALLAHDLALANGGRFLLRIEDIDRGRSRPEFVIGIQEELRWLGLNWDGPAILQSSRMPLYEAALNDLIAQGLAYRCWCTRAEIAASAGAPQEGDHKPIYPGTCKGRAAQDGSLPFCWRLDMALAVGRVGPIFWHDSRNGEIAATPLLEGDIVIARKDMPTSYHLAVTLDDAAQDVTDVVRGNDLFEATHIHRLLQALLGLATPRYHHHPLIAGDDGERLAKRKQSPALAALREQGMDPLRLISGMRDGVFPIGFQLLEA
jgi:glutamyl-Q tRNA(Asp) synthetase